MIRRNTWILLVVLVALAGFWFYLGKQKAQQAANATPTAGGVASSAALFSAQLGSPTDITIKDTTGKTVQVTRTESGTWVLKAPMDTAADQGASEAAATQLTSLRVLSNVQLDLDVVGLTQPSYTMSLKFSGGSSHSLAVGAVTPIQDGYYVSLDGGPVKIVDKQGLDALIQMLSQPPYAATPVPTATSTAVETPTPEVTATVPPPGSQSPVATAATPATTSTP